MDIIRQKTIIQRVKLKLKTQTLGHQSRTLKTQEKFMHEITFYFHHQVNNSNFFLYLFTQETLVQIYLSWCCSSCMKNMNCPIKTRLKYVSGFPAYNYEDDRRYCG